MLKKTVAILAAISIPELGGAEEIIEGLGNPISRSFYLQAQTTAIDISDLKTEYIDPIRVAYYFPRSSNRTHYKALIAFPLGGNDYIRTGATDAQIDSASFTFFKRVSMKRNQGNQKPYLGNFFIDKTGRLKISFENLEASKVLFQLKVRKYPDEKTIPPNYQGLRLEETGPFINALVLTPGQRLIVVKGIGRGFFEMTNKIAENGYVFRMDAGMNAYSYSSDPNISNKPGWDSVQTAFEEYHNIGETAGLVFYNDP